VTPTDIPKPTRSVSNTDVAREILQGGNQAIGDVKGMQNDPKRQEKLLQSLQGVKESLNNQLKINQSNVPPKPTPVSLVPPEDLLNDYQIDDQPAAITVVVKADPRANFLRTLDKIFIAVSQRKVTVDRIFIIGKNKDLDKFMPNPELTLKQFQFALNELKIAPARQQEAISVLQQSVPNTQILMDKLHFKKVRSKESVQSLIEKYQVESSPAWIVKEGAKTTLIQGEIDPREFLNERGKISSELRENTLGGSPILPPRGKEIIAITEFVYSPPPLPEPPKAVLPMCTRSRIRRLQVGPATMESFFSPEILIFSPEDPGQLELAEKYRGALIAASPLPPNSPVHSSDELSPFVLSQPLRCLPTRMHYVNVGGRQYVEFRQGEAAWVD
jgi:hypothetical protein